MGGLQKYKGKDISYPKKLLPIWVEGQKENDGMQCPLELHPWG